MIVRIVEIIISQQRYMMVIDGMTFSVFSFVVVEQLQFCLLCCVVFFSLFLAIASFNNITTVNNKIIIDFNFTN